MFCTQKHYMQNFANIVCFANSTQIRFCNHFWYPGQRGYPFKKNKSTKPKNPLDTFLLELGFSVFLFVRALFRDLQYYLQRLCPFCTFCTLFTG